MFPKPKSVLVPNTYEFESGPMVKATGFREYDARWLFEKEINLMGIQALGMGLGALIPDSYDDGLVSAIAICEMLDRAPDKSMADLKNALAKTWSSPTMSPHCADETKYGVADALVKQF